MAEPNSNLTKAQDLFILEWGRMSSSWGINRTMAQIHALLFITGQALEVNDIMDRLQISRGNASMNLRELMDWGIVKKEHKVGERKEYFSTGKDVWDLAKQVSRERRRREIEPILNVLAEVQHVSGDNKKAVAEFKTVTKELHDFSHKVDGMIEKFTKSDQTWFFKLLMKL